MKKSFVVGALFGLAIMASAQESVTLRYNLQEGKVYRYSTQFNMSMEGAPMPMDMGMKMVSAMKVKSVKDGLINLAVVPEFMKMKSGLSGANENESSIPEQLKNMRMEQVFDLMGNPKQNKVTNKGATNPIAGLSELSGSSSLGSVYPVEAVSVGSKWSFKPDLSKMLGMMLGTQENKGNLEITYMLKSFSTKYGRKTAIIEIKASGSLSLSGPGGQSNELAELKISGSGLTEVDLVTGLSLTNNTKLKIEIGVKGGPASSPQNMVEHISVASELVAPRSL